MALFTSMFANKALSVRAEGQPTHDAHLEGEKTIQKAVNRRVVDYAGPYVKWLQQRFTDLHRYGIKPLKPTAAASLEMLPPCGYVGQPATCYATKFVHVSVNKIRCSINTAVWTPEGRRCLTGTQSGEFTLWNGSQFNFETILQAHETPIRSMQYSHNARFLLSTDDGGQVKYWKPNLELVKAIRAHGDSVRAASFSCTDLKFATASDDSTVKVWDFARCETESTLAAHGGDVKAAAWHPSQAVVASAGKDTLVKLWDVRAGASVATLHGHKATIMQAHWNANGNWLLTASRDQTCKVYDVRTQRELAALVGHGRDVTAAAWHPWAEEAVISGGFDGTILYWLISRPEPQAEVRGAHEGSVWSFAWHPGGHVLATGAADATTKFWCRARPGDAWRDRNQREQEEGAASEAGAGPPQKKGCSALHMV